MNELQNVTRKMTGIINTSIEGLEYIKKLLNDQKYIDSMHIFEVILEGYNSIYEASKANRGFMDDTVSLLLDQMKEQLILVIKCYETNVYGNIWQVISFSLLPSYKKLLIIFNNKLQREGHRKILIGVYHPSSDLSKSLYEDRTKSLVMEAEKREVTIMFFNDDMVDFENGKISGQTFVQGKWISEAFPFPDVIQNYSLLVGSAQSEIEKKLRRQIPFTTFAFGNKYEVPKSLRGSKYLQYFAPFRTISSYNIVKEFFKKYKEVVLKPFSGKQGRNIYFVTKKEEYYHISEHTKKYKLSHNQFENFINGLIDLKEKRYLIQPFINSSTKNGHSFDIRAHLQKNGLGKWEMTLLYPRISSNRSSLTNMRQGAKTMDIDDFYKEQFGNKALQVKEELVQLAFGVTEHLDKMHGFSIEEVGIDIAIDENMRFWIHEINQLPGARIDEYKRAVNAIAYAIFLAEKQIIFENKYQRM